MIDQAHMDVPMVFRGDRKFVEGLRNPTIDKFLAQLPPELAARDFIFDSRCHLLQVGMYGCIPGWHLDHIKRNADGHLVLNHPHNTGLLHFCMFDGVAPTEIITDELDVDDGAPVCETWKPWDTLINAFIGVGALKPLEAKPGEVFGLRWDTFHRGTAAATPGTRVFMRASFGTGFAAQNEIRRQTQVYVPENFGW